MGSVTNNLGRLLVNLIPGGQVIYFTSMYGSNVEDNLVSNPDANLYSSTVRAAVATAIEMAIEQINVSPLDGSIGNSKGLFSTFGSKLGNT